MNEQKRLFHRPPICTNPDELKARIARLRSVVLTLDDPEEAARLSEFIVALEVQLLEAS